ncbi:MAG: DEAD/DEAH box helicase [Puniceicoccales bacterium]|jgi:hypothetical protein|nr:DEAD/DEAH box helicase [Puniceicoccales bacterium]
MRERPVSRSYSEPALALWLERLAAPWEWRFRPEVLETARAIYRKGEICGVHLFENDATVHIHWEDTDAHAVMEWRDNELHWRTTLGKNALGDALAAAGLYEVEELLGEEYSDAPAQNPTRNATRNAAKNAAENIAGNTAANPSRNAARETARDTRAATPPRTLVLAMSVGGDGVVRCAPLWEDADGGRLPAYGDGAPNLAALSSADTVALLRLATHARRCGFCADKTSAAWRLDSPPAVSRFARHELATWRQRWRVEGADALAVFAKELPPVELEAVLEEYPPDTDADADNTDTDDSDAARAAVRHRAAAHRAAARFSSTGTDSAFRMRWRLRLGGGWLPESAARRLFASPTATVLVPGRGIARLAPAQQAALAAWSTPAAGKTPLPRHAFLSLFGDERLHVSAAPALLAWRDALLGEPTLPAGLPDFLRPYQAKGVAWLAHMLTHGTHPLLADEMGLGKTAQVLALAALPDALANTPPAATPSPATLPPAAPPPAASAVTTSTSSTTSTTSAASLPMLVVCPASVVPVWAAEAARFFPQIPIQILRPKNNWTTAPTTASAPVLWLASYARLRRDTRLLDNTEFSLAVLDEAQFIKNPDAKITAACLRIRARRRLALTGTPLENHPRDIWSLFRFLMPGLLGTRTAFEARLENDPAFVADIARQIHPFVLRRTKRAVAPELPPKVTVPLLCPLTDTQRELYRRLVAEGVAALGDTAPAAVPSAQHMGFLALLTRLRQAACDPALLPGHGGLPLAASGKLAVLAERLAEVLANGRRAVVFSQFTSLLRRVALMLEKNFPDVPVFTLTGSTGDREAPVRDFQGQQGAAVFLASLRAGGTGVTLHSAGYVFLLDPWWNPAVEAQAADRVHRIGQRETTFVYRMIAADTVEARVEALKEAKAELFANVVGDIPDMSDWAAHFPSLRALIG